tara:strand:+ start:3198 stop:4088 length:891 start_codon:yes stop_codon:yes gene_type:complete
VDVSGLREAAQQSIADIAAGSELQHSACAGGQMPWRRWPQSNMDSGRGTPIVLLHGGSGSWTHWLRNVGVLSAVGDVYAADLPGLGDAAMFAGDYTAQDVADCVVQGLHELVDDGPVHLVGFSWGCTPAALAAAAPGIEPASLTLVGPASVGDLPRRTQMQPLIRRTPDMSDAEVWAANQENLARLMFHDRTLIDPIAVYAQVMNQQRARFNSRQFALSDLVLQGLRETDCPALVLYGEFDAPAWPEIEARRTAIGEARPDATFEVVPAGGHWLQYECDDVFNACCLSWFDQLAHG